MDSETVVSIALVMIGLVLIVRIYASDRLNLVLAALFLSGIIYLIGPSELFGPVNVGAFLMLGYLLIPPVVFGIVCVCRRYAGEPIGILEENVVLVLVSPGIFWLLLIVSMAD